MTDEQIIEGLRCCNNGLCEICPYREDEFIADCREQNGNDALDLIKRQQEEIERLKAKSAKWTEHKDEKYTCIAGKSEEQRLLHLVNKLTEEVDRLKAIETIEEKEHQYCKNVYYPMHEREIAMLTKAKNNLIHTYKKSMVSAIREFAENLKKDIQDHSFEMLMNGLKGTPRTNEITYETVWEYIDNLVKEMTEEA